MNVKDMNIIVTIKIFFLSNILKVSINWEDNIKIGNDIKTKPPYLIAG